MKLCFGFLVITMLIASTNLLAETVATDAPSTDKKSDVQQTAQFVPAPNATIRANRCSAQDRANSPIDFKRGGCGNGYFYVGDNCTCYFQDGTHSDGKAYRSVLN